VTRWGNPVYAYDPPVQSRGRLALPAVRPVVSVVMPVFEMPLRLVERALRSVALQDYPGLLEIVIWNDGSRRRAYNAELDHLASAVQRPDRVFGVRHSPHNRGISAARNNACKLAHGQWLMWLDGDDELPEHAVSHLIEVARGRADTRLVLGQCRAITSDGGAQHTNDRFVDAWRTTRGSARDPLLSTVFAVHGALVHRTAFWAASGFDDTLSHGELTDWFLRMMARLPSEAVAVTSRETYRYHKRFDSHSAERAVLERARTDALRRYAGGVGLRPPRTIRFKRRCADTGARLYDLFTTRGNPVVLAGDPSPDTTGHPSHP